MIARQTLGDEDVSDAFCLKNGQVLTADGTLEEADLCLADGRIVDSAAPGSIEIDCRDLIILPGIVDAHGDAFEQELEPRPGVTMPFELAMGSVERQLLSNGITTAYHGLTLSWEPGGRSLAAGRDFMARFQDLAPRLRADHRVQLRWETYAHDAIADLSVWLDQIGGIALAFNDHTTATLRAIELDDTEELDNWARRAGLTLPQYLELAEAAGKRAPEVEAKIKEVAGLGRRSLGRRNDVVMLSHDEQTAAERRANRVLGMSVCEFPVTKEAAKEAVAHGEHVILGGPNVLRGGSHSGALSAEQSIEAGLCTVLPLTITTLACCMQPSAW